MWFVSALFSTIVMFCAIRYIVFQLKEVGEIWFCIVIVIVYAIGLYLLKNNVRIDNYWDLSLLIMPIVYLGFITKKYLIWNKLDIKLGILCGIILLLFSKYYLISIDLSQRQIFSPLGFIPLTLLGIYFHLSCSKIISCFSISKVFNYLGTKSFDIMALHVLMFKITSFIYVIIFNKSLILVAEYPVISEANSYWWIFYVIISLIASIACIEGWKFIKAKIVMTYL